MFNFVLNSRWGNFQFFRYWIWRGESQLMCELMIYIVLCIMLKGIPLQDYVFGLLCFRNRNSFPMARKFSIWWQSSEFRHHVDLWDNNFWANVLPLCSMLQNYFQGKGVISCMSKIAVMFSIASSSCNADFDSCWLQCIQALYKVWYSKDVPWWHPSPSTVFQNRAHNEWLFVPAVATVTFLHSNGILQFIVIVVSLKLS
jgi:hypothetical protein